MVVHVCVSQRQHRTKKILNNRLTKTVIKFKTTYNNSLDQVMALYAETVTAAVHGSSIHWQNYS
jgi:hypothetical protein